MKTVGRRILIKLEGDAEVIDHISLKSGHKIYYSSKYGADERTKTNGLIVGTNPRLEAKGLKIGARVWFNRFVIGAYDTNAEFASNSIILNGEKVYDVDVEGMIFAYMESESDELKPFDNYSLLKMRKVGDLQTTASGLVYALSGYFGKEEAPLKHTAELVYLSEKMSSLGYKRGDVVSFKKDHDTPIEILGESLIAIEDRDIVCSLHSHELQRSQI